MNIERASFLLIDSVLGNLRVQLIVVNVYWLKRILGEGVCVSAVDISVLFVQATIMPVAQLVTSLGFVDTGRNGARSMLWTCHCMFEHDLWRWIVRS